MNAYWIDAGRVIACYEYETGYEEEEQACGIYFGETRGKAKVEFLKERSMLEYTSPMRIRLLAKNMDENKPKDNLYDEFNLWTLVDDIVSKEGYFGD